MLRVLTIFCHFSFLALVLLADPLLAAPARHSDFKVSPQMRPRVEFWKEIFSKYGKFQAVIHHRTFPYIKFETLDFSDKANTMSEAALDKYRARVYNKRKAAIVHALKNLAAGKSPQNSLERHIEKEMSVLGSGTAKYREVIKEDLIRSQRGIRERYEGAIERSGRYMHVLEEIFVKEFGLPVELTRLPFVESSFDYKAYSSVGAAGIWQFMPATARAHRMKITRAIDERRDIVSATRGAAEYLRSAHSRLGNWGLALTSYNHGVGGVSKKVKQLGTRDITKIVETRGKQLFGFASQNFFPEFLAALEIYDDIPRYFPKVRPSRPVYIAGKKLKHSTSVRTLQKELGVSLEDLKEVNYALLSGVWSGRYHVPAGYVLKVPQKYKYELASMRIKPQKAESSASSVYGGIVYRVRRGDTLSGVAKKYKTSVAKLRTYNNLKGDHLRVGQSLIVKPRARYSESPQKLPGTKSYRVRKGDSLYAIAKRYGMSASRLRELNGLSSSKIYVGQVLILAEGATAPASSSSSSSPSSKKYYKVRSGDTLWEISKKHGITIGALKKLNGMKSSKIKIGQRLRVQ